MSELRLSTRELRVWADQMAARYAVEIPDYARLDPYQLKHDVALVSSEFLRLLATSAERSEPSSLHLMNIALEAGRRRRQQAVSLPALLRAYRLWGKYTLEFLTVEAPTSLVGLASEVASQVDVVSEASARSYQALAEALPSGPIIGLAGTPDHVETAVLAQRYLASVGHVRCDVEPRAVFLLAPAGSEDITAEAQALAEALDCVLVIQAGHGDRLDELKNDLREAVGVATLLSLPAGVYDTRYMWLVSLGMSSPKYRGRFLRMLAPLEPHPALLETLTCYLDTRLSPKTTAERLGIHVNTVAYRLAKVEELMDCDLKQMTVRTTLNLALVLRKAFG